MLQKTATDQIIYDNMITYVNIPLVNNYIFNNGTPCIFDIPFSDRVKIAFRKQFISVSIPPSPPVFPAPAPGYQLPPEANNIFTKLLLKTSRLY